MRWLPDLDHAEGLAEVLPNLALPASNASSGKGKTIVLADDNADMRGYLQRLLESEGYQVAAAPDGEAAFAAIKHERPDLVLSDVMMPMLDGFGLLSRLRADPNVADVPVVLLSARTGSEAQVEGLEAGADDYLAKPFAARELLARVSANIHMATVRRELAAAVRESEARFRNMADHAPVMMWVADETTSITYLNRLWHDYTGRSASTSLGHGWQEAVHPDDREEAGALFGRILSKGAGRVEYRLCRSDGQYRWVVNAARSFPARGAFSAT